MLRLKPLVVWETHYWTGETGKSLPAFRDEKEEPAIDVRWKIGRQHLPFIGDPNSSVFHTKHIP